MRRRRKKRDYIFYDLKQYKKRQKQQINMFFRFLYLIVPINWTYGADANNSISEAAIFGNF